jgi:hypothetical protein
MTIATPDDVVAVLGRDLTTAETASVTRRIQSAVEILEGLLNRTLELNSFVETRTPIPAGSLPSQQSTGYSTIGAAFGTVALQRRPVASITSVVTADPGLAGENGLYLGDLLPGANITASCVVDHDTLYTPTLGPITVTYLAGDDPVAPQVREAVINAVARYYFVPPAAAAGVDVSYSVEGTSITYSSYRHVNDPRYGPFTGDEIRGLSASLRRFVLR